jgi:hypothetical protein
VPETSEENIDSELCGNLSQKEALPADLPILIDLPLFKAEIWA